MTNKDLDLPTQQELLAQFRCDEISNVSFAEFEEATKGFRRPVEAGKVVPDLGKGMLNARLQSISENAISPPAASGKSLIRGLWTNSQIRS